VSEVTVDGDGNCKGKHLVKYKGTERMDLYLVCASGNCLFSWTDLLWFMSSITVPFLLNAGTKSALLFHAHVTIQLTVRATLTV
jgi:hypothetical protein